MHRFILGLVAFLAFCQPIDAGENVYYVTCRIWNNIPRVGILHHACILICEDGVEPFIKDSKGRNVGNPVCTYYGSRCFQKGFNTEGEIIDLQVKKVQISPELVRQHLKAYDRKWTLWYNCQTAAKWAISPTDKSLWAFILKKAP